MMRSTGNGPSFIGTAYRIERAVITEIGAAESTAQASSAERPARLLSLIHI